MYSRVPARRPPAVEQPLHLSDVLSRPRPSSTGRREWCEAQTLRAPCGQSGVIGIELALDAGKGISDVLSERLVCSGQDHLQELRVAEHELRIRFVRCQPAVETVAAGIRPTAQTNDTQDGVEKTPAGSVSAALQTLEVPSHDVTLPRRVTRLLGDGIPIAVMRHHGDHRVVRCAPAQRPGARIEHSAAVTPEFRIATLLRLIGVVPDEEAPMIMVVLGRASGLEEQYPVTRPGEVRGQRPAAGAGTDYDVLVGR